MEAAGATNSLMKLEEVRCIGIDSAPVPRLTEGWIYPDGRKSKSPGTVQIDCGGP